MGSKTRLSSYCTKRGNNTVNLVTSRKINVRLARPIAPPPVCRDRYVYLSVECEDREVVAIEPGDGLVVDVDVIGHVHHV